MRKQHLHADPAKRSDGRQQARYRMHSTLGHWEAEDMVGRVSMPSICATVMRLLVANEVDIMTQAACLTAD